MLRSGLIVLSMLLFVFAFAQEETAVSAPFEYSGISSLNVSDAENDDGTGLMVRWEYDETAAGFTGQFNLYREDIDGVIKKIGTFGTEKTEHMDYDLVRGHEYKYFITAVDETGNESSYRTYSGDFIIPTPNLFKKDKLILLLMIIVYMGLIIMMVELAKKGTNLFIRKISGLDALDEAVGRATEMGRPILYVPGLSSMSDIATIASLNILGPVSKKVAEYETRIIVPNRDAIVMTVAKEVVKESYTEAGRPDAYSDNDVFFLTDSQFGYAAAVNGIMVRERPATNLFLGMFWAESLILAETGNTTGAIQIAGTDAVTQLPFFITSCDYTIIGEELYAASAYLSREPILLGSLKAQDYFKAFLIFAILLFLLLFIINGIAGGKVGFLTGFMEIIRFIFNT